MQNFTINYGDGQEQPQPEHHEYISDRIEFINCKSGLLIATPAETDDKLDYMVPVCLGRIG